MWSVTTSRPLRTVELSRTKSVGTVRTTVDMHTIKLGSAMTRPFKRFSIRYSPEPSGKYTSPFWYCQAHFDEGFDIFGDGLTSETAMADCIGNLVQEIERLKQQTGKSLQLGDDEVHV